MFARILKRMRDLVRRELYVMTTHSDEEADADGFSVFDVESAILMGEIVERQKDAETGEWKYVIFWRGCRRQADVRRRKVWHFSPDGIYPYGICGITAHKLVAKTVAGLAFKCGR